MKITKEELEKLGFSIIMDELKPYGNYFTGLLKCKHYDKIEVSVSNINDRNNSYTRVSNNHFMGNLRGHIKNIEELQTILNVMMRGHYD